jgi:hypothetical protein
MRSEDGGAKQRPARTENRFKTSQQGRFSPRRDPDEKDLEQMLAALKKKYTK